MTRVLGNIQTTMNMNESIGASAKLNKKMGMNLNVKMNE